MADTNTTTKRCTKCGEHKPLSAFSKDKRLARGLLAACKVCRSAAHKAWREENKDKNIASKKAWYEKNKDSIRNKNREHYEANRDRYLALAAEWRTANKESRRIYGHNRRARQRDSGGRLSVLLSERLFKLQRGKCACCGKPLGDDYHLDHIMPIALGGTNTDNNMQLLRSECNLRKHAKHPVDFMRQRGFLL